MDGESGASGAGSALGEVRSADGTAIGYRWTGTGPAVVLRHGAGQSSGNLMRLARALSGAFTVYVPDRRGRGRSGPYGEFLLGGSRSARNLAASLEGLGRVLPDARRVVLHGTGHTAPDNGRQPDRVAAELLGFFSD